MKRKIKICFVTGSRAEYGLLEPLMRLVRADRGLVFQLAVTGSHLSRDFGFTYRDIEADGFRIDARIPILSADDSAAGATVATGKAVIGFAGALRRLKPDILVLLGDRFEILAAAEAALLAKIPVAHLAGGDVTEGAFDDAIRHSITKMSHLHFVTHEEAARRVRQLGEDPRRVFNVGYTGLDRIRRLKLIRRAELEKTLGFKFRTRNVLVTFHPATLDPGSPAAQFAQVLKALELLGPDTGIIFTKPNADPEGRVLGRMIDRFAESHRNAKAFVSLGQLRYFSVMKQCSAVVGNSSSGLYEAPALKVPTVNIGSRQAGRIAASSVIHCRPESAEIRQALRRALSGGFPTAENPYGDGTASEKIFRVLKEIHDPQTLVMKRFFNIAGPAVVPPRVYVIAEAGVNHNGSVETAKKMVDCAAEAGADAVKFQTFKAERLLVPGADKAEYQKKAGVAGSQWEMIKQLELSDEAHREIAAHCRRRGIEFLSTPFDEDGVDLLAKIGVRRLKAGSGELTNAPLLLKMAASGLPVILSTGMATLEEIGEALAVLAFGYLSPAARPARKAFQAAFESAEGQKALKEKVTLLQCTTEYPAPFKEANLRAMDTLRERFGFPAGFSDHTRGVTAAVAAAARGAAVIEKHFTLDRTLPGPDHAASLEPQELAEMVRMIREAGEAMGSGEKAPQLSEKKNIPVARRSLVAARRIRRGELFTPENLAVKRPGTGLSPFLFWDLLGKPSNRDYSKNEAVRP